MLHSLISSERQLLLVTDYNMFISWQKKECLAPKVTKSLVTHLGQTDEPSRSLGFRPRFLLRIDTWRHRPRLLFQSPKILQLP